MAEKAISIDDLKQKIGPKMLGKMSPALRATVMSGGCTLQVGGVVYRAAAGDGLGLVEKSTRVKLPTPETDAACDDDPPEPVRLRGELLEDFESRHYRWMRGVTESPDIVETFVEPPSPLATKINPALQRPETPHAQAARIAAETVARRHAAAGPKPAKLARVLEPFDPEPAEHLLRAPTSVHETHNAMRLRLARAEQAAHDASLPTRPSKIAARLDRVCDAPKGAA